jgi:transposase
MTGHNDFKKLFTSADKRRLAKALKSADKAKDYRRLQAVLIVARAGLAQAAHIAAVSKKSVRRWVKRYLRRRQTYDLSDKVRTGRPLKATDITGSKIIREIRSSPIQSGYMSTVWTVPLLATHLSRKYHEAITPRTLRRRMKDLSLSWKRPRYVYHLRAEHIGQKKGPLSVNLSGF